jgi:two-component system, sporulation sensor kinase D
VKRSQNVNLYILSVIIPIIILSLVYWLYLEKASDVQRQEKAEWTGTVHQQYLDKVIKETKDTLEILALSSESIYTEIDKMDELLMKAREIDPRFAGMYMLDRNGKAISGTNPAYLGETLLSNGLVYTSAATKKPVVVDYKEKGATSFEYFSIASPILDSSNNIQGFLLAQIRLDYIENLMRILTPDYTVIVENKNGEEIFSFENGPTAPVQEWIRIPLEEISWTLFVVPPNINKAMNVNSWFLYLFICLIITHILFLNSKYLLLRRETKKQKKVLEAQKLELISTLAAGTAHEIRNPLTGIKGLVQLLGEKHKSQDDQYHISVILGEIERINHIVSEFLVLGKPNVKQMNMLDIRESLQEIKPIIESEAKLYDVHVKFSIPNEPVYIKGTNGQVKQVILNIAKNGMESMSSGGILSIDLKQSAGKANLSIMDTGTGMSETEIAQAFTPFFTSKNTGTGLGLFICKQIVELFDGTITLTSEPSKGTKAEIIFPLRK